MGEERIIVVANQKGGVGKTTLCIAYANYLVLEKGLHIGGIIDCDPQASIKSVHEQDLKEAKGTELTSLYDVISFDLLNYQKLPALIESMREENLVYIFDTPGQLTNMGIVYLLAEADIIICPFCFDSKTLDSTLQFLKFWNNVKARVKQQTGEELKTKVFLVPNDIDNRFGTIKDKEKWNEFEKKLRTVAIVTDQIRHTANLTKISTLGWKDNQKNLVFNTCQCIDNCIQGTPLYKSAESESDNDNVKPEQSEGDNHELDESD